jgi:hypothetical protein
MICLLKGPDHIFEVANEHYLQFIGKGDVIGKTAREVVPEAESQGFFELLDKVYTTGEAFVGNEVPIQIKDSKGNIEIPFSILFISPPIIQAGKLMGSLYTLWMSQNRFYHEKRLKKVKQSCGS